MPIQYASVTDANESQDIILLVHGINVDNWDWNNTSQTVFKRLYAAGYHGKFATVDWPCNFFNLWSSLLKITSIFNESEIKAYKAGAGMKTYMDQLHARNPGYRLHLLVHSQGNAVVSEAIEQGAAFDTYILTEGALPASAYDVDAPTSSTLVLYETLLSSTPEWQPMGYHGVYTSLTGRIVNYYNWQDPVLDCWMYDQGLGKPDGYAKSVLMPASYYTFDGSDGWHNGILPFSYLVADPQESRAFISRSRTLPIGQSGPATAHGVIQSGVDLNAQFGFKDSFPDDHSAQWVRPIQTARPYYLQVLDSIKP